MNVTKPIRKQSKVVVKVNKESYRIQRNDPKNLVIEHLAKPNKKNEKVVEPYWYVLGYYGRIEDLVHALIKITVGIPQHADLVEQVKLLRQELQSMEKNIVEQLKVSLEEVV